MPNTKAEAVENYFRSTAILHSSIRASTSRSTGNRRRITGRDFKPFRGLSSKTSREWSVYEKDVKRYRVGELRSVVRREGHPTRIGRQSTNQRFNGSLHRGCVPEVSCSGTEKSRAYVSGKSSHHWKTGSIPPELVSQNQLTY